MSESEPAGVESGTSSITSLIKKSVEIPISSSSLDEHEETQNQTERNLVQARPRRRDYNNKTVVIGSVIFWVFVVIVIVITVTVLYLKIDPRDLDPYNESSNRISVIDSVKTAELNETISAA